MTLYRTSSQSGLEERQLTIPAASDVLVIADHTFGQDALRGTSAALCPYVRAQSKKHREWSDVIQD